MAFAFASSLVGSLTKAADPADDFSSSPISASQKDSNARSSLSANHPPREPKDADFSSFSETAVVDPTNAISSTVDTESPSDNNSPIPTPPIKTTDAAIETPKESNGSNNSNSDININNTKRYVTPQDFELLKVIGMGAFGKVLQVRNRQTHRIYAMKVISKRRLRHKASYIENMHVERDILTKINHPFVVSMHCSFQTKEKLFIVMDFLAGGELFLRLGREGIFLERTCMFYVGEIILALEHLHLKGILHRDLKPENILLGTDGHLVLTDFGLAKDFRWDTTEDGKGDEEDGRALTVCGTTEYMAPEMVARKGYGKAADWWSLGCITFEMLSGRPPFESKKGAKDLFRKIMNDRVRMPDGASAAACELMKGLLRRDAISRFGAAKGTMFKVGGVSQVKQLAFFSEMDWSKLEKKEIIPPESLDIDGEDDLRHFYDEFTNMRLPRSVKEISDEDFKPRRCDSDLFRGFSFIQEDFVLPDRSDGQQDHYWNNCDEDGESMSDCASSKYGDDDDPLSIGGPQRNAEPPLKSTPEHDESMEIPKKKRNRKKKKKGNVSPTPLLPVSAQYQQANTPGSNEMTKDIKIEHIMKLEIQRQLKMKSKNRTEQDSKIALQSNGNNTTTSIPVNQSKVQPTTSKLNQINGDRDGTQTISSRNSSKCLPQAVNTVSVAWASVPNSKPKKKQPPPPTWETVGKTVGKPRIKQDIGKNTLAAQHAHMTNNGTSKASSLPQSIKSKQTVAVAPVWKSVPSLKSKRVLQPPPPTWETVGKSQAPTHASSQNSAATFSRKIKHPIGSQLTTSSPSIPSSSSLNNGFHTTRQVQGGTSGLEITNWRDHKMSRNISGGHQNNDETKPILSLNQNELWPSLSGSGNSSGRGDQEQNRKLDRLTISQRSWGVKATQNSTL